MEVNVKGFWESGIVYAVTSFFNRTFQVRETSSKHFSMFPVQKSLHCLWGLLSILGSYLSHMARGTTSPLPCPYRFEDSSGISGKVPSPGSCCSLTGEGGWHQMTALLSHSATAIDSCRWCHPRGGFTTCAVWFFGT